MKIIVKGVLVAAGVALASAFGGTAPATASPSSTLTVQDGDSGGDGAAIDADGTQGDYKAAMDGTSTAPIMFAVPQDKAVQ